MLLLLALAGGEDAGEELKESATAPAAEEPAAEEPAAEEPTAAEEPPAPLLAA